MNAIRRNVFLFVLLILISIGMIGCALQDLASLPQRSTQAVASLSQTVAAQRSSMGTADADAKTNLETRESAMGTAIAKIQSTSTAQESLLQSANEVFTTATQVAMDNSTQIAGLNNTSATQAIQIEDYNNSIRCSVRPNSIDFKSNASVSASLKSWLERTQEWINTADWEVIWEGTEVAIHRFEGQYFYVFIVYFNEPDNDSYTRIYDVYNHCFIYP
jgi:hypothetical protein